MQTYQFSVISYQFTIVLYFPPWAGYVMTWHSWAAKEPGDGTPTSVNCARMRKDGLWEDYDCADTTSNYALCMRAKCK